jgi:hypothetical protein
MEREIKTPTVGRIVTYFLQEHDRPLNNGAKVAPAIVLRPWGSGTVNLMVFMDGGGTVCKGSVIQANSFSQLEQGHYYLWPEDCARFKVDLGNPYVDLSASRKLIEDERNAPTATTGEGSGVTSHGKAIGGNDHRLHENSNCALQKEEATSGHSFTEGMKFPESQQATNQAPAEIQGDRPARQDQLDPGD